MGPAVSGTLGDMMESGHVGLQDGREGRGNRGRACHWRGDETGAEVVAGGLVEAGALGGRPRGRILWQFPESPGRQREYGLPLLTHAHLRHLAEPLQRQQRVSYHACALPLSKIFR